MWTFVISAATAVAGVVWGSKHPATPFQDACDAAKTALDGLLHSKKKADNEEKQHPAEH